MGDWTIIEGKGTPGFRRVLEAGAAPITAAGTKVSVVLVPGRAARSRFLHQASRCGTSPRDRANVSSVLPLRPTRQARRVRRLRSNEGVEMPQRGA
jgi:hypothetical protein